ncbi:MAG: hypothetical protein RL131_83 [Bacteroidota bacterium]|jgi:shikimate dehydrogenase
MRRFGLIGYPLSHSFSKKYFTEKFQREGLSDHQYDLFPIESIEGLKQVLADHPDLVGINVTIPYKEQVLSFLDERNEIVQEIGACNCIHRVDGKLKGYNTDVLGFIQTWEKKLNPSHKKALVLGTGGAAKAVHYACRQKGISYLEVSRTKRPGTITYADLDDAVMKEYTAIINTTPVGMYPEVDQCPELPYESIGADHYLYDLVYNPSETLFLKKGAERGAAIENGADMLVIQAEASFAIWNS